VSLFKGKIVHAILRLRQNHRLSIINHQSKIHFRRGDIVVHKKFGLGTVKEFNDSGENSDVVVAFNTGQVKTLMVKYANLKKL
jgi:transcription elongation factor GreA-like protein